MLYHPEYTVVLGSKSPRRIELLTKMDIDFKVHPSNCDEHFLPDISTYDVPVYLAKKKNQVLQPFYEKTIIITCDTVVINDQNHIVEKPSNLDEAFAFIKNLCGKKHTVVSGVYIYSPDKECSFSEHTQVWLSHLSDIEIDYYVNKYHPLDKAGAYGVQEWIGIIAIEKIIGSFYNVMGLPTEKLYKTLMDFGFLLKK